MPMDAHTATRTSRPVTSATPPGLLLQRKCACGTHASGSGTCTECTKKIQRVQRHPEPGQSAGVAPPSVHAVLATPGSPLAPTVRAPMERGFGHDFSHVRVHNDAAAAHSAATVDAAAYTVGSHVVFGAGSYAPGTRWGRHLIAHELAHVVQQGAGGLMRKSLASLMIGSHDDPAERDADQAADRVVAGSYASPGIAAPVSMQRQPHRRPAFEGLDEAGPGADFTGQTDSRLAACLRGTRDIPNDCPHAPLTLADFSEVRSLGGFAAVTGSDVVPLAMDPVAATCMQTILGWTADQTHVFQGIFLPRRSHVIRSVARANNPNENGCARAGRLCNRNFTRRMPRGMVPGSFTWSSDASCPAAAAPTITAATRGDCAALVTQCTANAVADQSRLLAHEQGHLDIACKMARRFNDAIRDGTPLSTFTRPAVLRAVRVVQDLYDAQTHHGCIASAQASWVADIAAGLPNAVIPTAPPSRRRTPPPRSRTRPSGTSMRLP